MNSRSCLVIVILLNYYSWMTETCDTTLLIPGPTLSFLECKTNLVFKKRKEIWNFAFGTRSSLNIMRRRRRNKNTDFS